MKTRTKRFLARIGCAIVSGIIVLAAVLSTMPVSATGYGNSLERQVVAHVMERCIADNGSLLDGYTNNINEKELANLDLFNGTINISVGPSMEYFLQQSSTSKGKIDGASNNSAILGQFFNTYQNELVDFKGDSTKKEDIISYLCEKGILTVSKGSCTDLNNTKNRTFHLDAMQELVEDAYNKWLETGENADGALSIEDIRKANAMGLLDDKILRNAMYNDLVHGCGVSETKSSSGNDIEFTYIEQDTGIKKTMYMPSDNAYNTFSTIYNNDGVTCQEVIGYLEETNDEYLSNMKNEVGKGCYKSALADSKIANSTKFKSMLESSYINGDKNNIDYSVFAETMSDGSIDCKLQTNTDGETVRPERIDLYQDALAPDKIGEYVEDNTECFNNGTDEVGWIVCSVTKFLRKGVRTLYDYVIVPFLEIDADAFNMNGPVFRAWQTFQSFANVMFVIFLLIIIFSQITGYGIDNYGIKKMLPRLIVAAILVNLSYVICQLAVDLSNLVGYSINNMFEGIASTAMTAASNAGQAFGTATEHGSSSISGALIFSALGAGGIAASTSLVWGPTMLLALIPALVTVIVSVLFLFVILGARRAAAVILVVISPLAFVCYMLPNTKKLFDRWVSIFKTVLLVFPICGLLMGGGAFAGSVLWQVSNGYFIGQILAALTTELPFFFIPKVLKSSLAAFGNLGATISNLGNTLGRGTANKIRNSDGYKAAQRRAQETKNFRKAGINVKTGQATAMGNLKNKFAASRVGRFVGYDKLQRERIADATKSRESGIEAQKSLQGKLSEYTLSHPKDGATATPESLFKKQLQDAQKRGDTNGMYAAIDQAKAAGVQGSHIADITRNAFGDRDGFGGMSEGEVSNFLREYGNRYGNDFLAKDFEQARWAQAGGMTMDGSHTTKLSNYAATGNINIDDLKDNDVAALSGNNLNTLVSAGVISRGQAQRVWSGNQNMDDTERLMLGAYANHGTNLTKSAAQTALKAGAFRDAKTGRMVATKGMLERSPEKVEVINVPHGPGGTS